MSSKLRAEDVEQPGALDQAAIERQVEQPDNGLPGERSHPVFQPVELAIGVGRAHDGADRRAADDVRRDACLIQGADAPMCDQPRAEPLPSARPIRRFGSLMRVGFRFWGRAILGLAVHIIPLILAKELSMLSTPVPTKEPYRNSAEEVLAALGTDAQRGLSEDEARARLEPATAGTSSPRRSRPRRGRSFLRSSPTRSSILLLVATAISAALWLLERDSALPYEAIAIFAVVLLNALMGYIQEARAEQAVAALRRMAAAHANVIRGGARQSVAAAEVVPGDILLIEEGDTIAADARLIELHRAADRRSGAHRREPAGLEGHRTARRRSRARRPPQHGVQRHRGDLRPRQGGGHRDRHADRDGAHRGHAEARPRPRPRRCRRSWRASASCSASSSSRSRW